MTVKNPNNRDMQSVKHPKTGSNLSNSLTQSNIKLDNVKFIHLKNYFISIKY